MFGRRFLRRSSSVASTNDVLLRHAAAAGGGRRAKTEYFETAVEPNLSVLAADVVRGAPATIAAWLRFYAAFMSLEHETLLETTLELWRRAPSAFRAALDQLPEADRAAIEVLLNAADAPETVARAMPPAMRERMSRRVVMSEAAEPPILARFVAEPEPASGPMRPLAGKLSVSGRDGTLLGSYEARTGRNVRGWWNKHGPTPPGFYRVSNYRPSRDDDAMTLNGVSYSLNIDPTSGTDIGDRDLLRIHPDGNVPGTIGCIGVLGNKATLRKCAADLSGLLSAPYRLTVSYGERLTVTTDTKRWSRPDRASPVVEPDLFSGADSFLVEPSGIVGWVEVVVDGAERGYLPDDMVQPAPSV